MPVPEINPMSLASVRPPLLLDPSPRFPPPNGAEVPPMLDSLIQSPSTRSLISSQGQPPDFEDRRPMTRSRLRRPQFPGSFPSIIRAGFRDRGPVIAQTTRKWPKTAVQSPCFPPRSSRCSSSCSGGTGRDLGPTSMSNRCLPKLHQEAVAPSTHPCRFAPCAGIVIRSLEHGPSVGGR